MPSIAYETVKNQREERGARERFFYFQIFESYGSAVAEEGTGGALDPPEFFRTDI